jgi:hypothetical protein
MAKYVIVWNPGLQELLTVPISTREWLGFEVLTAVSTKMAVFWVLTPCSLVEVYQRFRGIAASIIRVSVLKELQGKNTSHQYKLKLSADY